MGTYIHSLYLGISLLTRIQRKKKGSIGGNNSMDLLPIAKSCPQRLELRHGLIFLLWLVYEDIDIEGEVALTLSISLLTIGVDIELIHPLLSKDDADLRLNCC